MITPDRRIILFDFGTALDLDRADPDDLQGMFGTPPFVSPEQVEARPEIDGRADLYSLGVILYRMVTGRKPFYGSRSELLDAHLKQQPPRPSQFAHVAPGMEAIILKLLAKDPADRFQTARELIDALDDVELTNEEPSLSRQFLRWLKLPMPS
jgi:serine/threonine protein kinase